MHITITRKRMKSIRLTIEPTDGSVKVSAPKRVSIKQIQDFVARKKERIQKAQEHYAQTKDLLAVPAGELLLHGVGYRILPSSWAKWNEVEGSRQTPIHSRDSSALPQNDGIDHDAKIIYTKKDLTTSSNQIAFYKAYAKEYLPLELQKTAEKHGLTFGKCIIRGQKTKRGTCSATKNIWLNWKLVKMPHDIAQYVICHELAHLTHLNHSPAFWEEVTSLYPDYKVAEAWMKKYGLSLQ